MTEDKIQRLKLQIEAAHKACEILQKEMLILIAGLHSHTLEVEKISQQANQLHHDHQTTRQIVSNIFSELEVLVPKLPKGGK